MGSTKLQKVNRLPEFMMNSKEVILSVSLAMCNTESLTTKTRELINAYKSEIESEKKFVCCFINLHCLLLPFTILFLPKGNLIISIAVDSLFCQL